MNLPKFVSFPVIALGIALCGVRPEACQAQATDEAMRHQAFAQIAHQADELESMLGHVRRIVQLSAPSVVHIEAQKSDEQKHENTAAFIEEAGAGVVVQVDNRFFVMTNRHVVVNSSPEDIQIQLVDGTFFHPIEIRSDHDSDIAILYVDQTGLTPANIGDSDRIEVGDFVLAIGSPFGLSQSVSYGIISGKSRRDLELGVNGVKYQDFLQTDAAINPGNSGGPLINSRGEVIGVNTAIASNSGGSDGIGFTIPINDAMKVADELAEYGFVRRGFLGVSLDSRYNPKVASELGLQTAFGARVSAITPDSPAATTDLQVGDVILKFDGKVVENDSHLVSQVSQTQVGREVELEVYRSGAGLRFTPSSATGKTTKSASDSRIPLAMPYSLRPNRYIVGPFRARSPPATFQIVGQANRASPGTHLPRHSHQSSYGFSSFRSVDVGRDFDVHRPFGWHPSVENRRAARQFATSLNVAGHLLEMKQLGLQHR